MLLHQSLRRKLVKTKNLHLNSHLYGGNDCHICVDMKDACHDNVILTGKLSSGYYEYTAMGADGLVVPKPDGAGQ